MRKHVQLYVDQKIAKRLTTIHKKQNIARTKYLQPDFDRTFESNEDKLKYEATLAVTKFAARNHAEIVLQNLSKFAET